jgi:LAO/AO transport system kinase
MTLAEDILAGSARAAARLISLIEADDPQAGEALDALAGHGGKAAVIGLTGAPGTGKSTLADALTTHYRARDLSVGVLAVDPSSPVSGGALLGDRVRMQRHAADPGVFIRSLATRGWEGGLAGAAVGGIRVLDALGRDIVLLETVGAGQVEVDIAAAADTTLLVLNPGAGDDIQTLKAGILETADVLVVNKVNRDGADRLQADLEAMTALKADADWRPPVVMTEAVSGRGVEELVEAVSRHREHLQTSGGLAARRRSRLRLELLAAAEKAWREAARQPAVGEFIEGLLDRMNDGTLPPRRAALDLVHRLAGELDRGDGSGGETRPRG